MDSFDFLYEEEKASFSVLLNLIHTMLLQQYLSHPCDVVVKGSVKVGGKQCMFKGKSKITKQEQDQYHHSGYTCMFFNGNWGLVVYWPANALVMYWYISWIFEVIQHWCNCSNLGPGRSTISFFGNTCLWPVTQALPNVMALCWKQLVVNIYIPLGLRHFSGWL